MDSPHDKKGLFAIGVLRPIGIGMIVCASAVFGLISLSKLPIDLLPPINYPSITVRTAYPGAAPSDVEERVTERLEDALATVGNLVKISSSSRAEVSEISLKFEWDTQLPLAVQDIRERIDRVFLPNNVEKPLILRYDPSLDPIIRISLSGDTDLTRLRDIAESEIERELEGIQGVAAVRVKGGLEDEVHVLIDPQLLASYKISAETIQQRLIQENLNVPGGTLEEGSIEYVVRTLNQFQSTKEIENLPIISNEQTIIKLGDLAKIKRSHKKRDMILKSNGEEAVEIAIYREADSNISTVAKEVKQQIELIKSGLNKKLSISLLSDQSVFIESAIKEVQSAALYGGIFAVLICFLFLRRYATTFIIGIAVPTSIIATFGAMYASDVTLNIMSLGGLALGIGMLVDNAIVVLESITRCREEGDSPISAAIRGVKEVGTAVTASTFTTIAVFTPIIFVEGIAGQTFGDQALTVVSSLLISLAVALFFIPGIAARLPLYENDDIPLIVQVKKISLGITPYLRDRKIFGDLNIPKKKSFLIISLICALISGYIFSIYLPNIGEKGKEIKEQVVLYQFLGSILSIPIIWVVVLPITTIFSRILVDITSIAIFISKLSIGLLLETIRAIFKIPMALFNLCFSACESLYPKLLSSSLKKSPFILLLAVILSAYSASLTKNMGRELIPEVLQGEINIELFFPSGNTLSETTRVSNQLELKLAEIEGVVQTATTSGTDRETITNEESGPHTANLLVKINTKGKNSHDLERQVTSKIRNILEQEPALARYNLRRPTLLTLNSPLEVEVIGQDLEQIAIATQALEKEIASIPGIQDLRTSLRRGNPEILVSLNRDVLARYQLTAEQISSRLRIALEGETASTFPGRDERIDIRVQADSLNLNRLEQLKNIPINPESSQPIPLSAIAQFKLTEGPSDIRHIGSRRAAVLSASTNDADLGNIKRQIESKITNLSAPTGIRFNIAGQTKEMESALSNLTFALALAIFLVYAVMAAQFESLLQPLLILFTVPMAGAGAIWVMAATNTPISVIALLGAVILAGIVVNNAIVLVDRINQNLKQNQRLSEAIIEAASTRLRPILMTTMTTVLGMLPMTGWIPALGGEEGSELRTPMALVVMSGLLFSTLLTLIVIPCGYSILAKLQIKKNA